jgi:hypothetical protein
MLPVPLIGVAAWRPQLVDPLQEEEQVPVI